MDGLQEEKQGIKTGKLLPSGYEQDDFVVNDDYDEENDQKSIDTVIEEATKEIEGLSLIGNHYVVCIPSYKRADICNNQTLAMLNSNGIPSDRIYVYVANAEEYAEYERILDPEFYSKIVIGELGLVQQRNFICSQWPEGQFIVSFDDDIKEVDLSLTSYESLGAFFFDAFNKCVKENAYIWGVILCTILFP